MWQTCALKRHYNIKQSDGVYMDFDLIKRNPGLGLARAMQIKYNADQIRST